MNKQRDELAARFMEAMIASEKYEVADSEDKVSMMAYDAYCYARMLMKVGRAYDDEDPAEPPPVSRQPAPRPTTPPEVASSYIPVRKVK